jgi:hypothetical protein
MKHNIILIGVILIMLLSAFLAIHNEFGLSILSLCAAINILVLYIECDLRPTIKALQSNSKP